MEHTKSRDGWFLRTRCRQTVQGAQWTTHECFVVTAGFRSGLHSCQGKRQSVEQVFIKLLSTVVTAIKNFDRTSSLHNDAPSDFRHKQKIKSVGIRFGVRGGHAIYPPRPVHLPVYFAFNL